LSAGQHPVEQDEIGQHGVEFALRGHAVFCRQRLEAFVSQVDEDEFGNVGLVFDDEDARFRRRHGIHRRVY
jgi:hypothetical protein